MGIHATLPYGVSDQPRLPLLSSTCTPTSNNPVPCVCTNRNSASSSISGSQSSNCGCRLGVTWPGRSSNHTSSRGSSSSWMTSIGGSPTIAVSSFTTPANTLGGANTRRCAMPSAPFGCSVFDLGRVGTYRTARNSVNNSSGHYSICTHAPAILEASDHRRRKADAFLPLSHLTLQAALTPT